MEISTGVWRLPVVDKWLQANKIPKAAPFDVAAAKAALLPGGSLLPKAAQAAATAPAAAVAKERCEARHLRRRTRHTHVLLWSRAVSQGGWLSTLPAAAAARRDGSKSIPSGNGKTNGNGNGSPQLPQKAPPPSSASAPSERPPGSPAANRAPPGTPPREDPPKKSGLFFGGNGSGNGSGKGPEKKPGKDERKQYSPEADAGRWAGLGFFGLAATGLYVNNVDVSRLPSVIQAATTSVEQAVTMTGPTMLQRAQAAAQQMATAEGAQRLARGAAESAQRTAQTLSAQYVRRSSAPHYVSPHSLQPCAPQTLLCSQSWLTRPRHPFPLSLNTNRARWLPHGLLEKCRECASTPRR